MEVEGGNVRWVENMYVDCGTWITSAAMICVFVGGCGCGLAGGTYINMCVCVHTCVCMNCVCMNCVCMCVYVQYLRTCVLIVDVCVCVCVCMCVCVHVCVCAQLHTKLVACYHEARDNVHTYVHTLSLASFCSLSTSTYV